MASLTGVELRTTRASMASCGTELERRSRSFSGDLWWLWACGACSSADLCRPGVARQVRDATIGFPGIPRRSSRCLFKSLRRERAARWTLRSADATPARCAVRCRFARSSSARAIAAWYLTLSPRPFIGTATISWCRWPACPGRTASTTPDTGCTRRDDAGSSSRTVGTHTDRASG